MKLNEALAVLADKYAEVTEDRSIVVATTPDSEVTIEEFKAWAVVLDRLGRMPSAVVQEQNK